MGYDEYRKKLEALNAEISELREKYIASLPFHVDDKIKIKDGTVGWICSIRLCNTEDMIWVYINPQKKNGKRAISTKTILVSINEIEVIND